MNGLTEIVATGVVSFVAGVLLTYFRPKPKVAYWSPHSATFQGISEENLVLMTDALTVQNTGRKPADDVEIVLTNRPDHFQISPPVDYEEINTPDGSFLIRIPKLGPKEFVTVQALTYAEPFSLLTVRSSAGTADAIDFRIQRVYPTWFRAIIAILLVTGLGFSSYWLVRATLFVSQAIGIG